MNNKDIKDKLRSAFELGYLNAAKALSQLMMKEVSFNNFYVHFHNRNSIHLSEELLTRCNQVCLLVTTEIFGDVTGKSFLFLNQFEYDLLTSGIPKSKNTYFDLSEEYVKEIDNILSASVLTRLSDELELDLFGDVPLAIGEDHNSIEDMVFDNVNRRSDEVYVNSIFFSLNEHPDFCPVFVWVVDGSIRKLSAGKKMI